MGLGTYIFVVVAGGGAGGGLIYSLTTGDSHKLRLPFYQKKQRCLDIETGFLGHMFIGAFAGLLLVSLAISHLSFNPSPLLDYSPTATVSSSSTDGYSPASKAAMIMLHTLAISMIGGFLGLKLIVKIADEAYGRLDKKLKALQGAVNEQEEEREVQQHILSARALRIEGLLDEALKEVDHAIRIRPTKTAEFVKALILRRKKDFTGAIAAVDRASKLDEDTNTKDNGSIFWNKACYLALQNPENLDEIMRNIDLSLEIKPEYKNDILTEADFASIVDKETFKKHYGI